MDYGSVHTMFSFLKEYTKFTLVAVALLHSCEKFISQSLMFYFKCKMYVHFIVLILLLFCYLLYCTCTHLMVVLRVRLYCSPIVVVMDLLH